MSNGLILGITKTGDLLLADAAATNENSAHFGIRLDFLYKCSAKRKNCYNLFMHLNAHCVIDIAGIISGMMAY